MLYFDFDTHNNTDDKILASSTLSLSKNISETNFNRIALSKLAIDFNDSFFCHVPLKEKQAVLTTGPYQQSQGYFQTIYNVYYCVNKAGTIKEGVFPIFYKSIEKDTWNTVNKETDPSSIPGFEIATFDNFNSYFEVKNYNSFLKSVNQVIKYVLCDSSKGNLGTAYEKICPTFYTASNVLHSINLSSFVDTPETAAEYVQVSTPDECKSTQNTFCLGLSKILGENIYHPFLYTTLTISGLYNETEKFTFLNLDVIMSKLEYIVVEDKRYYLTDYQNTDFYEYMNDIQEILIHTNMPVATLYKNSKKPSFVLNSQDISEDISSNIILRLVIDHDRERLSKITYSNPSITNNFSQAYSNIGSSTYFRVYVSMVDKYNNIYPLYLKPNASMYIQMALFNK